MVNINVFNILKINGLKHILFLILISLFTIISCVSNRIKEPSLGITYKFYTHKPQYIINDSKYDFSRLEKGYGLLIFSYKLDGYKDGHRNETMIKKGVRIWEYKFSDQDEDTKIIKRNLTLFDRDEVPIPLILSVLPIEKDKKKEIGAKLTFKKNRVIYGGRISASEYENNYIILERFDEDCSHFLTTYSSYLEKIPLDTVLIQASKPFPKVKKPYTPRKGYYDL